MRNKPVAMLPTWRSEPQARILNLLLTHPGQEYTLTDIATAADTSPTTAHHEANRLTEAGILTERRIGRARLLTANLDHPATPHLTALAYLTYGAKHAVAQHFSDIDADRIIIFGSWAARHLGTPGPPPNDLDVLVLTDPENRRSARRAAYTAAQATEKDLGMPVHVQVMATSAWDDLDDPLIGDIRRSAHLTVLSAT